MDTLRGRPFGPFEIAGVPGTSSPLRSSSAVVEIVGETATFEFEMLDAPMVKFAFDLEKLPDLAMSVAAVLQATAELESEH